MISGIITPGTIVYVRQYGKTIKGEVINLRIGEKIFVRDTGGAWLGSFPPEDLYLDEEQNEYR